MIASLYKCFQHWSAHGSVWIIGDLHLDDSDCKSMDPGWPNPQTQMDLLKSCVYKSDTLIVLGDVGNPIYLKDLPCYKVLITGNHDSGKTNYGRNVISRKYDVTQYSKEDIVKINQPDIDRGYKLDLDLESNTFQAPFVYHYAVLDNHLFDEIYEGPLMIAPRIMLSHEECGAPYWLNIHGHRHDLPGLLHDDRYINVAANTINYQPINLGALIKYGALHNVDNIHRYFLDKRLDRDRDRDEN